MESSDQLAFETTRRVNECCAVWRRAFVPKALRGGVRFMVVIFCGHYCRICFKGNLMRCLQLLALVALCTTGFGCSGESEEDRLNRLVPNALDTTQVRGKVMVDGAPVKDLWVTLHPSDASLRLRPRGQTDAKGNFQITTYTGGDGAPPGAYKITIEWLTYIKRDSDWGGPDKLKNQYNDPATSPFQVTVEDDPIELPVFELKLAGVEGKPEPE
jgi:hypothetical protein